MVLLKIDIGQIPSFKEEKFIAIIIGNILAPEVDSKCKENGEIIIINQIDNENFQLENSNNKNICFEKNILTITNKCNEFSENQKELILSSLKYIYPTTKEV